MGRRGWRVVSLRVVGVDAEEGEAVGAARGGGEAVVVEVEEERAWRVRRTTLHRLDNRCCSARPRYFVYAYVDDDGSSETAASRLVCGSACSPPSSPATPPPPVLPSPLSPAASSPSSTTSTHQLRSWAGGRGTGDGECREVAPPVPARPARPRLIGPGNSRACPPPSSDGTTIQRWLGQGWVALCCR